VILTKDLLDDCPTNALVVDNCRDNYIIANCGILQDDYIGLYDDIITNCNALLNCRVCTYGTIFANNNGFGNGATIGNVLTVNLSTTQLAIMWLSLQVW
jgi:hypothetical protein